MRRSTVADIAQLLSQYRQVIQRENLKQLHTFQPAFDQLKKEFVHIKEETRLRSKAQAPGFNVFYLLRVERDEARTHSSFLANLLNPRSSHGQEDMFLRNFLVYCSTKFPGFPTFPEGYDSGRWSAHTEMVTQQGRLDIVLTNPLVGFLCLIENKIDAGEQSGQLLRYYTWMDSRRHEFPLQALIFLTIHGQESTTVENQPYYRLSYRQDIANWLEGTLAEIQAPGVKEVVKQYISVVARL